MTFLRVFAKQDFDLPAVQKAKRREKLKTRPALMKREPSVMMSGWRRSPPEKEGIAFLREDGPGKASESWGGEEYQKGHWEKKVAELQSV